MDRRRFSAKRQRWCCTFQYSPAALLKGADKLTPNEKVNVAVVGFGSQGGADLDAVAAEGHNIVALCDVDDNYAARNLSSIPRL